MTATELRTLRDEFARAIAPARVLAAEALTLERAPSATSSTGPTV